jgi:hypothetical protein
MAKSNQREKERRENEIIKKEFNGIRHKIRNGLSNA